MQDIFPIYQNRKLSAWLLCAGFLLSLFVFTGYSGKSIARSQQPVQTEWRYSAGCKTVISYGTYKNPAADLYEIKTNNSRRYTFAIMAFNSSMQVKLINACNKFVPAKFVYTFIQKLIPQSSEEYSCISIIG